MISIEDQENLLTNVSRRLKKQITVYAIGGTAMMFRGFKDSTLDIDLVFENEQDKKIFKEAAKSIGYKEIDSIKIYGTKENQPEMLTLGDERFDLFVRTIIYFIFSENMKERSTLTVQFIDNLILKIADPHDIILMKCATDRIKDKDDARNIINSHKIDWKIIIEEAETQIKLGKETAAFDLGCFLEDLKNEMNVKIPKEVLDELFMIVKKQSEEKINKKF